MCAQSNEPQSPIAYRHRISVEMICNLFETTSASIRINWKMMRCTELQCAKCEPNTAQPTTKPIRRISNFFYAKCFACIWFCIPFPWKRSWPAAFYVHAHRFELLKPFFSNDSCTGRLCAETLKNSFERFKEIIHFQVDGSVGRTDWERLSFGVSHVCAFLDI